MNNQPRIMNLSVYARSLGLVLLVFLISASGLYAQAPNFTAVPLDEFGQVTDTLRANQDDIVYVELQGDVLPGYYWGAIKVTSEDADITSIEESYDYWYNGISLWWTTASANPLYGGAGNLYYYKHIHSPDNDTYKSEGSSWAAAWEADEEYYGYPQGPAGSLVTGTAVSEARFYYSGYLGNHSKERPGIRLGLRIKNPNSVRIDIYSHDLFELNWSPDKFTVWDEAIVFVTPRVNHQSVHTEGNNAWIQVSGPVSATVGDTVAISAYGELLYDMGLYNASLVRTESDGVTSTLISAVYAIGNEWGPVSVSYPITHASTETNTGTMQADGHEPQSVNLNYEVSTRPVYDLTPPILFPATINPAPNANGWNNTAPVIVTPNGIDPIGPPEEYVSGLAGIQPPNKTFDTEDAGQTVTFVAYDFAGNQSEPQDVTVNIDWTPPVVTLSINPPSPNAAGWYKIPVGVRFDATDNLSGVDRYEPSRTHIFGEGKNQQFTCTVYDKADNLTPSKVQNINVDWTPPEFTELPGNITVEQTSYEGAPAGKAFLNGAKAKDQPALSGLQFAGPVNPPAYFPLGGPWPVVFRAIDNAGNWVDEIRSVTVVDTIPPVITPPKDIVEVATATFDGKPCIPRSSPQIQAFLSAAKAIDACDPNVIPTNDAPEFFFIGKTKVTFNAVDRSGNHAIPLSAYVTLIKVEIIYPRETPVTENNFTFDSAKNGKCTVSGLGTAYWLDMTKELFWSIEEIAGSKLTSNPGNKKGPSIAFTFTGLPSSNFQFGNKQLMVEYPPLAVKGARDNQMVQIFFSRDATNNPGRRDPNWYYYWKQTSANLSNHRYNSSLTNDGVTTLGNDYFEIGPGARLADNPLSYYVDGEGIDNFASTCRHENAHMTYFLVRWGSWTNYLARAATDDLDGDYLVDDDEQWLGYDPTQRGTATNAYCANDDFEDYACIAEAMWTNGTADNEDWSDPGHQSNR